MIAGAVRHAVTLLIAAALVLVALGLLFRWSESSLLYFPVRALSDTPAAVGLPFEDVALTAADGVGLHGWMVGRPAEGGWVILFLHGNAGNVSHRLEKLRLLHDLGASVLIVDYRGYGRSGGSPGEAGLYLDARAAYDDLRGRRGITPSRIVLYGESLGTAVAVDLATDVEVAGLILESVFTSVPDVGRELYPFLPVRWLARSRYDSLGKIGHVQAPLLILHSEDDEFFAMHHAERLLAAAAGSKRLVRLRGGHNDAFLTSGAVYRAALGEFLDAIAGARHPS